MEIVEEELLELDADGCASAVNEFLVAPLTKAQSNIRGTILFPGNLFHQKRCVEVMVRGFIPQVL